MLKHTTRRSSKIGEDLLGSSRSEELDYPGRHTGKCRLIENIHALHLFHILYIEMQRRDMMTQNIIRCIMRI